MTTSPSTSTHLLTPAAALAAIAALIATQIFVLHQMGHSLICPCGTVKLWFGDIQSRENSQHITDWYTFSHIIHGFIFYCATWLILTRPPWAGRLLVSLFIGGCWE